MFWGCENCAGKVDSTRWRNYVLILHCFFFRKLNKNHNNNIITIYILKIQVAI